MQLISIILKTAFGKLITVSIDMLRNLMLIKLLSVSNFGIINFCNNLIQTSKYLDFGFAGKFLIDSYSGEIDKKKGKQIFGAIFIFEVMILFIGLFCYLAYQGFSYLFYHKFSEAFLLNNWLLATVFISFLFSRLYKLIFIWLKHKKSFFKIIKVEFGLSIILLIFTFIFVKSNFSMFAVSFFLIQSLIYLVVIISEIKSIDLIKPNFEWIKNHWLDSLLLTSSTFIYGLSFFLDRFILIKYYSLAEFGYYSFLLFIMNSLNQIFTYMTEPIRAFLAPLMTNTKKNVFALNRSLFLLAFIFVLFCLLIIKISTPFLINILTIYLNKYSSIFMSIELALKVCLTFPILFVLGSLVVSNPYLHIKYFSASQIINSITLLFCFFGLRDKYSVYDCLLLGIYYGNLAKIISYLFLINKRLSFDFLSFFYRWVSLSPLIVIPFI